MIVVFKRKMTDWRNTADMNIESMFGCQIKPTLLNLFSCSYQMPGGINRPVFFYGCQCSVGPIRSVHMVLLIKVFWVMSMNLSLPIIAAIG